ncbi:MAG: hypothetical protein M9916_13600 [Crocinitomicaceae bacterium]|nr:hypothetical protein [Crocinitomicaceae bacterium]
MILKFWISCFIILGVTFTSCRKKELPVPAPPKTGLVSETIDLTSNYSRIVYYDLETQSIIGESDMLKWDLGFSCYSGTPYIVMNSAKLMLTSRITNKTFEQVTNTASFSNNSYADYPNGHIDSLAIREATIFVFDRGYDADGNELGFFKMELLEHTNTYFKGRFANLNGSNEQTITIQKDPTYNLVYMKWNQSGAIETPTIEPPKDTWDFVLTQYTEIFYEPDFIPYRVVGTLINRYNTTNLFVHDKDFNEINLNYAENTSLKTKLDEIGITWKKFYIDENYYEIFYTNSYIIKTSEGNYFKIRFIDFYNEFGVKGAPTFEFIQL